jgi:hypothetical protein
VQCFFVPHSLGSLEDGGKHAADTVGRGYIRDRAVADSEARIFGNAVSVNPPRMILGEETVALTAQDRLIERAQFAVNFRPDFAQRLSQGARVAITEQGAIGIVVDHDQVRSPPNGHREAGRQDELNAPFQGWGPALHRTKLRGGPVKFLDGAHVARTCHRFHWDRGCFVAPTAHPIPLLPLRPPRKRRAKGKVPRPLALNARGALTADP